MAIAHYIKEIGRGKEGARSLTRAQAQDMFGQILDAAVSDLEVGAFCLAMRIKGESVEEMAGFLDACYARMPVLTHPHRQPLVVLPSYNGARKLPLLTPLLALLLAREGFAVLVHGMSTETGRVGTQEVLAALGVSAHSHLEHVTPGTVTFVPTGVLCKGLERLLEVRRTVGLRNSAHSLVKLLLPVQGPSLLVTSYTHPEYAVSMAQVLERMQTTALLLRGTEGEAVADPRRTPKFQTFLQGRTLAQRPHQSGTLLDLPNLPSAIDAHTTASYIRAVVNGALPVPTPIAQQVDCVVQLASATDLVHHHAG